MGRQLLFHVEFNSLVPQVAAVLRAVRGTMAPCAGCRWVYATRTKNVNVDLIAQLQRYKLTKLVNLASPIHSTHHLHQA